MKIKIKKVHKDAAIPNYATNGSSGFDLHCIEKVVILPGETVLVKTGLIFEVPEGYELQIRPRSGLSLNTPLRISNSPGTIDSDYRGEVCVIIENTSNMHDKTGIVKVIEKGDRIAQGVICPVIRADFDVVESLSDTERGEGGFGSTGK